jgi:hypothetical protein
MPTTPRPTSNNHEHEHEHEHELLKLLVFLMIGMLLVMFAYCFHPHRSTLIPDVPVGDQWAAQPFICKLRLVGDLNVAIADFITDAAFIYCSRNTPKFFVPSLVFFLISTVGSLFMLAYNTQCLMPEWRYFREGAYTFDKAVYLVVVLLAFTEPRLWILLPWDMHRRFALDVQNFILLRLMVEDIPQLIITSLYLADVNTASSSLPVLSILFSAFSVARFLCYNPVSLNKGQLVPPAQELQSYDQDSWNDPEGKNEE